MKRLELVNRVAIVTGASSGIGAATARALAREGCHVALAARRADKIERLAHEIQMKYNVKVLSVPTDVSQAPQIEELIQKTEAELGGVDILVNNAGVGLYGRINDVDENELRYVFEVNFFAIFRLTQAVVPAMRRRNGGTIVNVSSIAGKIAIPQLGKSGASGGYSASKFAVQAMSAAARMELAAEGIHVMTVYPGRTQTEFNRHVRVGVPDHRQAVLNRQSRVPSMAASRVADGIVRSIKLQKREVYVRQTDRQLVAMANRFPALAERIMIHVAHHLDTPRLSIRWGGAISAGLSIGLVGGTLLSALFALRKLPFRCR